MTTHADCVPVAESAELALIPLDASASDCSPDRICRSVSLRGINLPGGEWARTRRFCFVFFRVLDRMPPKRPRRADRSAPGGAGVEVALPDPFAGLPETVRDGLKDIAADLT